MTAAPIARRQVLGCLCGTAFSSTVSPALSQPGCTVAHLAPCSITPREARGRSYRSFDIEDNGEASGQNLIDRSGVPNFDRALGRALVWLAETCEAAPAFRYWDEGADEYGRARRNARSAPLTLAGGSEGCVYFGLNMLRHQLANAQHGDMIILAICAHEFAHILQFREHDALESLLHRHPCHTRELHADFVAGFALQRYLRRRNSRNAALQDVGRAWSVLGSNDFNRPGSHGTSAQRVTAIEAGYAYANNNRGARIGLAMSAGIDHVRR